MSNFTEAYEIPEGNLPELNRRVGRLNRRCEKLGLEPIRIEITGASVEKKFHRQNPMVGQSKTFLIKFLPVEVSGVSPKLDGWEFIATLLQEEGGILLAGVPGAPEVPISFRDPEMAGECDHCGHDRYRKVTHVIRHEESGEWKRVGSACIKDFLGHKDPHQIARLAQQLAAFKQTIMGMQDPDTGWGSGSSIEQRRPLDTFLAWVASVVRHEGWMSRSKAWQSDGQATVDRVISLLDGPGPFSDSRLVREWKADLEALEPQEEDHELAGAAIEWAQAEWLDQEPRDLNDYERNMQVALAGESVGTKTVGLAGSLIAAYNRHLEKQVREELEEQRKAEASPAPKNRQEVEVAVLKLDVKENAYGSRYVMTVQSTDGWKAWGTVPKDLDDVKVGDRVTFRATFEQANGDPTFAFFKRPASGVIL